MDDVQRVANEAAGEAAKAVAAAVAADPRPVYQGDWQSATGVQKGQHSERVRQWKARQEAKGQRPMGTGSSQPVSRLSRDADAADPATRRVLVEIRDDHRALASDRIRAAQALIALDRGVEATGSGSSDLVALREALELLTPAERLAWLQGERAEHAVAQPLRA